MKVYQSMMITNRQYMEEKGGSWLQKGQVEYVEAVLEWNNHRLPLSQN